MGGFVAPSVHEVAVVPARPGPKLEPVSPRLRSSLQHLNRKAVLSNLHFSPDGTRILAADYPDGIVQLWDARTGVELSTIETGYGFRSSSEYVHLSPDWSTLFVAREKRKIENVERDGRRMIRWEMDGAVRIWDLASGELRQTFQHQPPRNILDMLLSPDGSRFVTDDELPGEYEGRPPRATTLWDVKTGQARPLPSGLGVYSRFAPDSQTLAITEIDKDGYATAVKLFDTATAGEQRSIPISTAFTNATVGGFSPDGRLLVGDIEVYPARNNWANWDERLAIWDVASGQEVGSLASDEKNTHFLLPTFSNDGRTLAVTNWRGSQIKLYLFDVPSRKLRTATVLGGQEFVRDLTISPDSRWIAVALQIIPEELARASELDPQDLPQPRILLVDAATGVVRETLVAPQGLLSSLRFSPDGRTLASGVGDKVWLWDFTQPPG